MFGRGRERKQEPKPRETAATAAPTSKIETIIGPNAYIRGDIQSDGGVRIDGVFEGSIDITGNLIVGEAAKIVADIKANNVSISGAIKGDVNGNMVEILETGRVWGDLTINSLLLNEGAYLRGQTTMHGDIEPPMIEPPRPRKQQPVELASATVVDVEPRERM
jgi:cytoskeletal protein CcmA (bactofilin family)